MREPFDSIPSATPQPPVSQGVPLPVQSVETPTGQIAKPTESSTLLTTAPLVINGLLDATVALMMIVRPQSQQTQLAQEANVSEAQSGDSSEALGILVVFLTASAIYISPYLQICTSNSKIDRWNDDRCYFYLSSRIYIV